MSSYLSMFWAKFVEIISFPAKVFVTPFGAFILFCMVFCAANVVLCLVWDWRFFPRYASSQTDKRYYVIYTLRLIVGLLLHITLLAAVWATCALISNTDRMNILDIILFGLSIILYIIVAFCTAVCVSGNRCRYKDLCDPDRNFKLDYIASLFDQL